MNTEAQLQRWQQEWAIHCSAQAEDSVLDVGINEASAVSDAPAAVSLTVGLHSDLETMVLRRLRSCIAPDLATATRERPLLQVGVSSQETQGAKLIQNGYILQLRPRQPDFNGRDLFVLVIESSNPARILVVPFGPLPVPAFVSEISTGMEDEALQVLCLWNSQWLPWSVAARSWHIANSSDELVEEVQTVRLCLASKKAIPDQFAGRIGPSALTAVDKRFVYLAKEEDIWNSYLA